MTNSLKCTAYRADGQPCRAWARRESDPPRCNSHPPNEEHSVANPTISSGQSGSRAARGGFYDGRYTLQEVADLVTLDAGDDLIDEVAASR